MGATCSVKGILFDYGGVLAEEGFREGLMAIARRNSLDPHAFFETAAEWVHASGYVTGRCTEAAYWEGLRRLTGILGEDGALRQEILRRFVLRDWMMAMVKRLAMAPVRLAILSDQTNWLAELDRRDDFFKYFHDVFNSFREGHSKRDPLWFDEVVQRLGLTPPGVLFVDDNAGNIARATGRGLQALLFSGRKEFLSGISGYCPFLAAPAP